MDENVKDLRKRIDELERQIADTTNDSAKEKKGHKKEQFTPLTVLYKWESPERVFLLRDKQWYLKISAIALLCILIAAFLQDFFIILVVCILVLVVFLLASIPPQKIEHEITNKGIRSFKELYKWKDLKNFFVAEKLDQKIVYINTKMRFPSRLIMLIDKGDENTIIRLIGERLEYMEDSDKQGWVSKKSDGEIIAPEVYEPLFKKDIKQSENKTDSPGANADKKK